MKKHFSFFDQTKAAAIVSIFETSKPLGNYSAVAVLDDGAGISYGISQFTHRSGALQAVVERYLKNGGQVGAQPLRENLAALRVKSAKSIAELAANTRFKAALRAAGVTREMRAAQGSIAHEMFMLPAIEICERMGFSEVLSLAVIHDSVVHGSLERIRKRVLTTRDATAPGDSAFEHKWIAEYVTRRGEWLGGIARLRPTTYRTEFFKAQIGQNNWTLQLPAAVNGVLLTDEIVRQRASESGCLDNESAEPREPHPAASENKGAPVFDPQEIPSLPTDNPQRGVQPTLFEGVVNGAGEAGKIINAAGERIDAAEAAVNGIIRRRDAVKSIWAAVGGTAWQAVWAVSAFLIGLPGYVWLIAALAAIAMALYYLYRQIELGKLREKAAIERMLR